MYDLTIIGAGISGLTASIFASRYGIKHLIFGQDPGGQGNLAHLVENYPGIASIKGSQLMQKIIKQVESYGVKIRQEKVGELKLKAQSLKLNRQFLVRTIQGNEYQTRSLILAMGASYRHLNIPGEEKFLGRGVSYCTSCDAPLFKGKTVAVVGGGDSAVSGVIHLANFAKKVYLIHRRNEFRAEKAWVEKIKKNKNIELILSSAVKEVYGGERVEGIKVQSSIFEQSEKTSDVSRVKFKVQSLAADGLFIEIGQVPSSVLAASLGVKLDERGYVLVGPDMATNVPGVFAAGDLAAQESGTLFRQFITAASDGARAAASVYHYLTKKTAAPSWGKRVLTRA